MADTQETRERVVAEAELLAGANYRVIRDEHGDYFTEYAEGGRRSREYRGSLDAALASLAEAAKEAEEVELAAEAERDAWRPENRGRLRTREDIERELWNEEFGGGDIRYERDAMEPDLGPEDY